MESVLFVLVEQVVVWLYYIKVIIQCITFFWELLDDLITWTGTML